MSEERFFRDWPAHKRKAAVALVPGLAEHSGRYEHVAGRLNDAGYSVVAVDIRGHGRSAGWPGMIEGLDDWVADARAVLERGRAAAGVRPLFLMGHSLGALIAATYVVRAGGDGLAGLVLSSLAVLAGPAILESMGDPEGQGIPSTALSRDVEVQRAYDQDPLVFADRVPPESTAAALEAAIEVNQGTGLIALPVLMFHGELDAIADPEGARYFFEALASTDKRLRIYDGLLHETMNEPEQDEVLDDLVAWLDEHDRRTLRHPRPAPRPDHGTGGGRVRRRSGPLVRPATDRNHGIPDSGRTTGHRGDAETPATHHRDQSAGTRPQGADTPTIAETGPRAGAS